MKILVTFALALIVGLFVGGYFAGTLASQAGTVLGMCNMAKIAQKQGLLNHEQTLDLAEATGRELKRKYASIADYLKLPDKSMPNSSATSDCNQFLIQLTKGIENAK